MVVRRTLSQSFFCVILRLHLNSSIWISSIHVVHRHVCEAFWWLKLSFVGIDHRIILIVHVIHPSVVSNSTWCIGDRRPYVCCSTCRWPTLSQDRPFFNATTWSSSRCRITHSTADCRRAPLLRLYGVVESRLQNLALNDTALADHVTDWIRQAHHLVSIVFVIHYAKRKCVPL